jgi:hypothetical protein
MSLRGMSLVDTTDSVFMLGAYGWVFVKPIRKLYYNMTITFVSVVVAVVVGGIEALGLAGDRFGLTGLFWDGIGALNDNFGMIGYLVIAIFVVSWIVSAMIYRARLRPAGNRCTLNLPVRESGRGYPRGRAVTGLPWFVWVVPEIKAAEARVDAWVSRLGVIWGTETDRRRSVNTLAIICW